MSSYKYKYLTLDDRITIFIVGKSIFLLVRQTEVDSGWLGLLGKKIQGKTIHQCATLIPTWNDRRKA